MPVQELHLDADRDREMDRDRDKDRDHDLSEKSDRADRALSKQKPSSSQKTKDLSHVPCKFFKVGACTAGSSCPFSHVVAEPGQKEVCAWFVKGNCKFGHKCALAHILPGQGLAMDRKNKKAAQAAAATAAAAEKGMAGSKEASKEALSRVSAARKRDMHLNTSVTGHGTAHGSGSAVHGGSGRNALLAGGSTAPTRLLASSSTSTPTRPPINMPLKAPISPSVPAPPLKDTDFASFAALDEMEGVDLPQGQGITDYDAKDEREHSMPSDVATSTNATRSDVVRVADASQSARREPKPPSPVPLPTSAPRPSAPPATTDFGPIGSPPSAARSNGLLASRKVAGTISPGTSPRSNGGAAFLHQSMNHDMSLSPSARNTGPQPFLPSSPFSAPVAQSIFLSSSLTTGDAGASLGFMGGMTGRDGSGLGAFSAGGMATSLGTGMTLLGGNGNTFDDFNVRTAKAGNRVGRPTGVPEQAAGEDDLEGLIPSSLSDLLTPEERRRRMSRSSQQKPHLQPHAPGAPMPTPRPPVTGDSPASATLLGHRYSRSVPAPSLLGDVKSIWADTGTSPQKGMTTITNDSNGLLTPNTQPMLNGGGNLLTDDMGLSMSMGSSSSIGAHMNMNISPSNASAAFLPGLHHHYLKAKQQAQVGVVGGPTAAASSRSSTAMGIGGSANLARNVRTTSGPIFPGMGTSATTAGSLAGGNVGIHTHGGAVHTYRTTPSPFDLTQPQHQHHHNTSNRALGAMGVGPAGIDDSLSNNHYLSSPSARALQAHAPGQSLPQGLAAGLSRIHALPPLPNLASPGTKMNIDVSGSSDIHASGLYGEWKGPASPAPNMVGGALMTSTTMMGGPPGIVNNKSNSSNHEDPNLLRMSITRAGSSSGTSGSNPSPPGLARGGPRYPVSGGGPSRLVADDDQLFDME
ncbi:hypothetical protein APHAL10511_003452 [Amanita phalloides]|nr:hypothetical protein APHAL10511_003452 [Amanita phalloides]